MGDIRVRLNTMTPEKREYTLKNAATHSEKAGYVNDLFRLLSSFEFIEEKLSVCGVEALIEDYELGLNSTNIIWSEEQAETFRLIQGAIRLSSHILKEDKTQLAAQLLGRLLEFENPLIQNFLEDIKINQTIPWLRPLEGSLTKPDSPLLRTLVGHTDEILALEVTPDSQLLISGSKDHTIKVWDIATGQEIYTLIGHTGSVLTLVLTSDGKQVISGSADHTIKIWSLETGQEIYTLRGHQGIIPTLALSSDGKILYSGSEDKTVKLWSLETQQEIAGFECQQSILSLAVTPDNNKLIACLEDGFLQIWDLKTLSLVNNWVILKIEKEPISLYNAVPDILNLISKYHQNRHDFELSSLIEVFSSFKILYIKNNFLCLNINHKNNTFSYTDSFICTLNIDFPSIFIIELKLSSNGIVNTKFTPDLQNLIYSYDYYDYISLGLVSDRKTIIYDWENEEEINNFNQYFSDFQFTPNQDKFIGILGENTIQIFDWGKMLNCVEKENKTNIDPTSLKIIDDEKWLIVYYNDNDIGQNSFMLYSLESRAFYLDDALDYIKISSDSKYIVWKPFLSNDLNVYDLEKNEVILNLEGESKVDSFSSKTTKIYDNFLFTIDYPKFLVYDLQDKDNIRELDEEIINFHILEGTSKFIICLPDKSIKFIDVEEDRIIEFNQYKEEKYILMEEKILESRKTNALEEDDDLSFFILDTYNIRILPYIESVFANNQFAISGYYTGYSGNIERSEKLIWNIETGEKLFTLDGKFITITADAKKAIFYGLKDSKNIRNQSIFHTLIIWSLEQTYTITNNTASIKFIDVTKDSQLILIQTFEKNNDATIRNLEAWSLETGQQVYKINLTGAILFVQINTDNSKMLVATNDQYLRIFNLQTGHEIFKIKNQWSDAQKEVTITPDFKEVISIYKGNNLIVWDLEMGKVKATFTTDNPLACYTVSPDGKTIVAAEIFGKLHFLTLEDKE